MRLNSRHCCLVIWLLWGGGGVQVGTFLVGKHIRVDTSFGLHFACPIIMPNHPASNPLLRQQQVLMDALTSPVFSGILEQ